MQQKSSLRTADSSNACIPEYSNWILYLQLILSTAHCFFCSSSIRGTLRQFHLLNLYKLVVPVEKRDSLVAFFTRCHECLTVVCPIHYPFGHTPMHCRSPVRSCGGAGRLRQCILFLQGRLGFLRFLRWHRAACNRLREGDSCLSSSTVRGKRFGVTSLLD